MSEYIVYSAPDREKDPTIYHNGVVVLADTHEDALHQRLMMARMLNETHGDFWISGPDQNEMMKLRRVQFVATAFEIINDDGLEGL